jgi:dTDP-glucose 4,6-dehydratase
MRFAAEGYTDRLLGDASAFSQPRVVGTFALHTEARGYWQALDAAARQRLRFLFGSLGMDGMFSKPIRYNPPLPYFCGTREPNVLSQHAHSRSVATSTPVTSATV